MYTKFKCADNSSCLPLQWKCDGEFDCPDHSDEPGDCFTCPSKQRLCGDGKHCIPEDWWCDGHMDCEDRTDEKNCDSDPGKCEGGLIVRVLQQV